MISIIKSNATIKTQIKHREKLLDIEFDNNFLDMIQMHRQQKQKGGKLDNIKIKNFHASKDTKSKI